MYLYRGAAQSENDTADNNRTPILKASIPKPSGPEKTTSTLYHYPHRQEPRKNPADVLVSTVR